MNGCYESHWLLCESNDCYGKSMVGMCKSLDVTESQWLLEKSVVVITTCDLLCETLVAIGSQWLLWKSTVAKENEWLL
jgi:hypothetical protein